MFIHYYHTHTHTHTHIYIYIINRSANEFEFGILRFYFIYLLSTRVSVFFVLPRRLIVPRVVFEGTHGRQAADTWKKVNMTLTFISVLRWIKKSETHVVDIYMK